LNGRRWRGGRFSGGWRRRGYSLMFPPSTLNNVTQPTQTLLSYPIKGTQTTVTTQRKSEFQRVNSTPIHKNCVHYSNGVCTFYGVPMPENGPACPNFHPKVTSEK